MSRKNFKVLVLTPYLTERFSDFEAAMQKEKGYDINNFSSESVILTNKGNTTEIIKIRNSGSERPVISKEIASMIFGSGGLETNLVISGSTEGAEYEINSFKFAQPIVARYSIFYGRESEYTGKLPEEVGYALDIPKNVGAVRRMLKSDSLLEACIQRDYEQINIALKDINGELGKPILTTPYLKDITK